VVGVTAYRTAFQRPKAAFGAQPDTVGATRIWVLPNPSGLNASWTAPRLSEAFEDLRRAAFKTPQPTGLPVVRLGTTITTDDVRELEDEQ
jgi:TDG/mug DNA glycosylase family protein